MLLSVDHLWTYLGQDNKYKHGYHIPETTITAEPDMRMREVTTVLFWGTDAACWSSVWWTELDAGVWWMDDESTPLAEVDGCGCVVPADPDIIIDLSWDTDSDNECWSGMELNAGVWWMVNDSPSAAEVDGRGGVTGGAGGTVSFLYQYTLHFW